MTHESFIQAYYTQVWNNGKTTKREALINIDTGLVMSIAFSKVPARRVRKRGLQNDAYIEWNGQRLELTLSEMMQMTTVIPPEIREQMKSFIQESLK